MIDKSSQLDPSNHTPRLRYSLRQLEVFVAIARGGSARLAAGRVARSQSAASAALAELEIALGANLFDRIGRRLVLNENGRAFLPGAMALLDQATELGGLLAGEHAAPLRVAASLTIGEYLLPRLIASWQERHPASVIRLRIANTSEVIASVVGLESDLGFIEGPQTHPDLRVHPWLSDELVIVGAPGHPLANGLANKTQLAAATWILREVGSGTRQATDAWLLAHLNQVQVGFELGSTEAIKRLAAAGTGLACLSRQAVAEDVEQGRLVELKTRLPVAKRQLAIVDRRDKLLGRATQDFMAHCNASQAVPLRS